jgi:signal transduction histidine kinase
MTDTDSALDVPAMVLDRLNPASERATRVLYFAVGGAGIAFGALSFPLFVAQIYAPLPALSWIIWSIVAGLPVVLCVFSRSAPLPVLRGVAVALAGVVLIDLILWLVARWEPLPAGVDVPWAISLTGVPAVCMAIVARPSVAVAYSLALSILGGVLRGATTSSDNPLLVGTEEALYGLLIQSVFIGLTLATRRGAAELDAAAREASDAGALEAAQLGARRARLSMDALVHDSVMSTLLSAGRGQAGRAEIARHAAQALDELEQLPAAERGCRDIPVAVLEAELEDLIAALDRNAEFRFEVVATECIPGDAIGAMVGATAQALHNSLSYAHGDAHHGVLRSIVVRDIPDGLEVIVRDDGVGFDPASVSRARLGISHSIIARMTGIPGGSASVSSEPGAGTEVVLSWTR